MGKITEALKKVADERVARIQKRPKLQYVVRKVENTKIDDHIVAFHDPASPVGEQYKILRTNIQSLKYEKNFNIFLITSSINREGKTVTSINLAMAMAQGLNDKSVLLIDADLRRGSVAKYLGLKRSPGLSEVLQEEAGEDTVFVNPGIANLTVMLAGKAPKNPSELLSSKKMEQLLATLRTRFDYIFIDSPPVMPVTDACIVGSAVDGVILVVQSARTQRDVIKHVEHRLYQARAKLMGYVLTNMEYHVPRYLYRYVHEYANYDGYYNNEKEKEEVAKV